MPSRLSSPLCEDISTTTPIDSVCVFSCNTFFSLLQKGGAIYNAGVLKFLKESTISFSRNKSVHDGGQIYNEGILVLRNEGSFTNGYAGGSGGAIYNHDDGVMT